MMNPEAAAQPQPPGMSMGRFELGCERTPTWMHDAHIRRQCAAWAIEHYPHEAAALIGRSRSSGRVEVWPVPNTAAHPQDTFRIAAADFAAAQDALNVLGVFHSHPDASAQPSDADRAVCSQMQLPWLIASVRREDAAPPAVLGWHCLMPCSEPAPLLGRAFVHGVQDCYSLIEDFYARECAIILPHFEREPLWWEKGDDLYMQGFERAGFFALDAHERARPGDVILMMVRARVVNHAGIFLGSRPLKEAPHAPPVPEAMLHHLWGRLSERTPYGGFWAQTTRLIIRHEQLAAQGGMSA